jgi:hypothetical protein
MCQWAQAKWHLNLYKNGLRVTQQNEGRGSLYNLSMKYYKGKIFNIFMLIKF